MTVVVIATINNHQRKKKIDYAKCTVQACRAGSDGSMSASGSAGPGFDPWQGSKFSFENFQPRG